MANNSMNKNEIFTEEFYEEIDKTLEKDRMFKSLFISLFSDFERLERSGNKELAVGFYKTIQDYLELNKRIKERIKERVQNDNHL